MRGKGALVALLASPSAGYTAQQPRPRARRRPTQLEATTLDAKAVKGAPLDIGVEEPARSNVEDTLHDSRRERLTATLTRIAG